MRVDINLATRPYEDAREFWTRWGLAVGVLVLLTLALLTVAARGWVNAGRDRQSIRQLEQQIAQLDSQRKDAQAYLDLPANRSTRDQSQFLNGLIQRKAFCWTEVFADLERVMPANLHVVSLKPELNEENQLQLEMKVAGDTRASALELVHRMEGSPHFQGTQLVAEGQASQNEGAVAAEIVAVYVPDQVERSRK
ncbi:MAG: PilN domain-containing protein [Terriglobales bacterium]